MSSQENEIKIELQNLDQSKLLTKEDDSKESKTVSRSYKYNNKNGKIKTVKRQYEVKSTNARNPEIKQRIIDVITKNKDTLLKENEKHVIKAISDLLAKENLTASYNFIRKHWTVIKESKSEQQ